MARVVVVTSRLPFPPREGHQLRSWHLIKALASRHSVSLLSFMRADDDLDGMAMLRGTLSGIETFPIPSEGSRLAFGRALLRGTLTRQPFLAAKYDSTALRTRLAALAREADIVHFDMLPLMRHADLVPAGTPVVYNAHNVEHVLLDTRARMEKRATVRAFLAGQHSRLRAFETSACRRAQLVLACSDHDASQLRALAPGSRIETIPNGVDLDGNRPSASLPAHPARLVFVGQMGWFPNHDGVQWFLQSVFPRILAKRPDAEFVLVGKAEGIEVPADVAARVTLAGFVPDLRPWVQDAAIYVVPLRAGSGTRLKVLEAMALGKAIVTTRIGSEGIALQQDENAVFADDAESFAAATLSLIEQPERVARMGIAARHAAEALYGWDAIGRDLLRHYDNLLADAGMK